LPPEALPGRVPETIEGVVMARLDSLDEQARHVLRLAAVLGEPVTRPALRSLVHAAPDRVRIHAAVEEIEREREGILACVVRSTGGDFPVVLELFPGAGMECVPISDLVIARFLAERCGARSVVTDGSLDPYRWTLVEADGRVRPVNLQPAALARDEMVIEDEDVPAALEPARGPTLMPNDTDS
jgi:hypothetical protein